MSSNPLIEQFKQGDPTAFPQILESCERVMHSVVRKHFPYAPETAEDVMQEARLKLWLALPQFKEESAIQTYAYSIATNLANDIHRRESSRPVCVPLDELAFENEVVCPGEPLCYDDRTRDPVDAVAARQDWEAKVGDVEKLKENLRSVFTLHRAEGWTYQEIALLQGVGVQKVKARFRRAVKKLFLENPRKI